MAQRKAKAQAGLKGMTEGLETQTKGPETGEERAWKAQTKSLKQRALKLLKRYLSSLSAAERRELQGKIPENQNLAKQVEVEVEIRMEFDLTRDGDEWFELQLEKNPELAAADLVRAALDVMVTTKISYHQEARLRQDHAYRFERWFCDKEHIVSIYQGFKKP